jgi:hypothetical protein
MSKDEEIALLRREVELFRRIVQRMIENPFFSRAPTFQDLVMEFEAQEREREQLKRDS